MNARRARDEWAHNVLTCGMWPRKRFVNMCTLCVTTREGHSAGDNEGNLDKNDCMQMIQFNWGF